MLSAPGDGSGRSGRVAYAVLAHSDQPQLLRLIRVLRTESPSCSVFVHWDASKEPLDPSSFEELGDVQLVVDRVPVEWGGFSLVEATLRTLRAALRQPSWDWIVLLSGHDYPIRPLHDVESDLHGGGVDAYMEVRQLVPEPPGLGWSRTRAGWLGRRYYFVYTPLPRLPLALPRGFRHMLARLVFTISKLQPMIMIWPMPAGAPWRIGIRRRSSPFAADRPCRSGSQWMSLSRRAASRVLSRVAADGELVAHFRRTVIPDEAFFHTILCGEPDLVVTCDNRRYENWRGTAPSHPEVLRHGDVGALARSGDDFARKVVQTIDPTLLDELDRLRRAAAHEMSTAAPRGGRDENSAPI